MGNTKDNDIILSRNTYKGQYNIIIHPKDTFSVSYIGNLKGRDLKFYTLKDANFEELVNKFMS